MERVVRSSKVGGNASRASPLSQPKAAQKFKRDKGDSNGSVDSVCHRNMVNAFSWLRRHWSKSNAVVSDSEDLRDIDDAEIADCLLHNEKEVEFRRILWEITNKKYMKEKGLKVARKEKASKPAKKTVKNAGETENKTRLSSKINYDVLKKLMDDESEEVPKKAEDDGKHSNEYHVDLRRPVENHIVEEYNSRSHEVNDDEYEHDDYGETNVSHNDYYDDMFLENGDDDSLFADDYE